ncbi:hypothetical protein QR680_014010 [Steinernema hermaphroditum]|uniref:C-type lectin domain-containing protein n=1 Tax=Steinernema hermaphroditum TaxID=289476 RepID=A0AA39I902_9BILA|nr:hypothetical protein QR680_014010 [Steinernema hermaphroditum]
MSRDPQKFFLLVIATLANADFCPKDSVFDNDRLKCYKFFRTHRSFEAAKEFCLEIGGSIAILPSGGDLIAKVKEHSNLEQCHFWTGSPTGNRCTLMLNWFYHQEVDDCSMEAPFLCEFDPTCQANLQGNVAGYSTTFPTAPPLTASSDCPSCQGGLSTYVTPTCPTPPASYFSCQAQMFTAKPPTWINFNNNEYLFVNIDLNWTSAEQDCRARDAHLTSVHSQCEFNFIISNICDRYLWTGGSYRDGVYQWTDGSEWGWENITRPQNGSDYDYRIQIYWDNLNNVESATMRYGYEGFRTSYVCKRASAS